MPQSKDVSEIYSQNKRPICCVFILLLLLTISLKFEMFSFGLRLLGILCIFNIFAQVHLLTIEEQDLIVLKTELTHQLSPAAAELITNAFIKRRSDNREEAMEGAVNLDFILANK